MLQAPCDPGLNPAGPGSELGAGEGGSLIWRNHRVLKKQWVERRKGHSLRRAPSPRPGDLT